MTNQSPVYEAIKWWSEAELIAALRAIEVRSEALLMQPLHIEYRREIARRLNHMRFVKFLLGIGEDSENRRRETKSGGTAEPARAAYEHACGFQLFLSGLEARAASSGAGG